MKKIFSTVIMFGAFMLGMNAQSEFMIVSADDKEVRYDITKIDSIVFFDRSQMEIKADTIFELDIQLPYSATDYLSVPFTLPTKKFYKMFGYDSPVDCVSAVNSNEVSFYFYSLTTKEIYSENHSAGTAANGGCWFNESSDVCTWNNGSILFVEPYTSKTQVRFVLGQYPDAVVDGNKYTLMMGLQNGETYIAFRLNITIGDVVAQESFVYDKFFEINEVGYEPHIYDIDTTGIAQAFGITYDEVVRGIGDYNIILYPVNEDGTIDKSESMLDMDGYWYTIDGIPCMPDDAAAAIKVEPTFEGFSFSFTQMPYATKVGEIYSINVALSSSNADVILTFNLTVVEKGFVPEGYTSDGNNNFEVYQDISTNYTSLPVLLDADAMAADLGYATADDLLAACSAGEITLVNLNADLSDGSATANNGGAWYDADGNTVAWGDNAKVSSEPPSTNFASGVLQMNLYMYHVEGAVATGDTYTMNKKVVGADGKESYMKFVVHIN